MTQPHCGLRSTSHELAANARARQHEADRRHYCLPFGGAVRPIGLDVQRAVGYRTRSPSTARGSISASRTPESGQE